MTGTGTTWETLAAAKRATLAASIPEAWLLPPDFNAPLDVRDIPRTCGILTPAELAVTETPAAVLVKRMQNHELTSEQVTIAFCKRAAVAHQVVNCLTETFFDRALETARAIDLQYATTGTPVGALHGLPVSLKDCIDVQGVDSSCGLVTWLNKPAETDADLTDTLRQAGAVFYAKTNTPPGTMMFETYCNIFGYTPNPRNTELTSGGSSGGEAALIAMYGSPLGVGTDLGGSIRVPAAMCGLYGLKPSGGRFSAKGVSYGLLGQEAVFSVAGPIAPNLAALELYAKTIVAGRPWERDPAVNRLSWRDVELPERLCFGVISDDGHVGISPSVRRVVAETRAALEAAGHTVIEWSPPNMGDVVDLYLQLMSIDGGLRLAQLLEPVDGTPEPWPLQMQLFGTLAKESLRNPPAVISSWDLHLVKERFVTGLLKSWQDTRNITGTGRPIDGVISPVAPFAGIPRYQYPFVGYTCLWNVANYSVVVIPAGTASKNDEAPTGTPRNDAEKAVWDSYNAERLDGFPVGMQVVAPRLEEELALKLAGVVEGALKEQRQAR